MLLTIDVGNTNVTLGVYDKDMLYFISRLATDPSRMEDQYAIEILDIFKIYHVSIDRITGVVIGSVVPALTRCLMQAVKKIFGIDALSVGYETVKDFFAFDSTYPEETGADLIAACVAAAALYPAPSIVVDMGTATKLMVIDAQKRMSGAIIMPGIGISMDALFSRAALLSTVDLKAPSRVIGKSTMECIQSGLIYGNASMIDGLCDRIESELGAPCIVIGTGGHSEAIVQNCKRKVTYNDTLVLEGLKIIHEKAIKSQANVIK